MRGNATYRYTDTAVLSVAAVDAPIVVTSQEIDNQLTGTYERVGLRPGMLEGLAGISERRWWPEDVSFADAASMAGAKALAEAGIDPLDVGLMIDSGQIDYALVVDGEGARRLQEVTIGRLQSPEATKEDVIDSFASLTLGSGGAAMVLGRASAHAAGHRFVGGVSRAATQYNTLCVGDLDRMTTDSRALLEAGVELAVDTWKDAAEHFDWSNLDAYVIHQVSKVHTAAITGALAIDPERTPVIFPTRGNVGPASIPFTLAQYSAGFVAGERIACLGIGSGLNSAAIEIEW